MFPQQDISSLAFPLCRHSWISIAAPKRRHYPFDSLSSCTRLDLHWRISTKFLSTHLLLLCSSQLEEDSASQITKEKNYCRPWILSVQVTKSASTTSHTAQTRKFYPHCIEVFLGTRVQTEKQTQTHRSLLHLAFLLFLKTSKKNPH